MNSGASAGANKWNRKCYRNQSTSDGEQDHKTTTRRCITGSRPGPTEGKEWSRQRRVIQWGVAGDSASEREKQTTEHENSTYRD